MAPSLCLINGASTRRHQTPTLPMSDVFHWSTPHSYTFATLAVWASIAVFILVFVVQLVAMATPDMRCTGRSFSHGANNRNLHYKYHSSAEMSSKK